MKLSPIGIGFPDMLVAVILFVAAAPFGPLAAQAVAPDTIGLRGSARAPAALGHVNITSTPAPFTMSVNRDGNLLLDLEFVIEGLLDPAPLGGDTYVAWVASPQLDTYQRIGPLEGNARARGTTDLNKWLAVITVENGAGGDRPAGAIVAHGLSPSGRMQSFQGHELFDGPKIGADTRVERAIVAQEILSDQPLTVRFTLADGSTVTRRAR